MVCACVHARMHLLTLVHYYCIHVHNHGKTKRQMHNCIIANAIINKTNIVYANDVTSLPLSVFVVWDNQDLLTIKPM